MNVSSGARPFPRGALMGAAALVGLTIVAAAGARLTGSGVTAPFEAAPVEVRDLRFVDRADGAVGVYAAESGEVVEIVPPGSNGFLRGVMRGLARERMLNSIADEPAFRLTRWADGRLSLEDPTTGRVIDLGAFGPTNIQTFARLLNPPGAAS